MLVILVDRVVIKKRIIGKNGGPRRRRTIPSPKKKLEICHLEVGPQFSVCCLIVTFVALFQIFFRQQGS
jgi:hypothetical protein